MLGCRRSTFRRERKAGIGGSALHRLAPLWVTPHAIPQPVLPRPVVSRRGTLQTATGQVAPPQRAIFRWAVRRLQIPRSAIPGRMGTLKPEWALEAAWEGNPHRA